MSETQPSVLRRSLPTTVIGILVILGSVLIGLLALPAISPFIGALTDLGIHLVGGFVFFLRDHLPRMSWNAATWIPGSTAFVMAILFIHRPLKKWAAARERSWNGASTCCLAALIPLLFGISFLVPGVLLQVRLLGQDPMIHHSNAATRHVVSAAMKTLHLRLLERSMETGRFPNTLADDPKTAFIDPEGKSDSVPEPYLYPGAGLPIGCHPSTPIVVSPPYRTTKGWKRTILTAGGDLITVEAGKTRFD